MTTPPAIDVSKLTQLKADAVSHRERLGAINPASFETVADLAQFVLQELGMNLAPMFESAVDALHEDVVARVDDLEDALEEMDSGDQLSEETAATILAVLQQGRALCNMLAELAKRVDAVTKKRIEGMIKGYRTSETAVRDLVTSITIVDDEPEPAAAPADGGEDSDDDEEDGEDGDEGETGTALPVAAEGQE